MARLRYNGLTATLGAALASGDTAVSFEAALTHSGGTAVPTIAAGDYIPLTILDSGEVAEIVHLTAYTSAATTGTISRGEEDTTAAAHSIGAAVIHAATIEDVAPEVLLLEPGADVPAETRVGTLVFEKQAPPTTTMWLASSGTPDISPAYDALWFQSGNSGIARRPMSTTRGETSVVEAKAWEDQSTDPTDSLSKQFISAESFPAAKTVEGTFDLWIKGQVNRNSGGPQLIVKVVSSDGSTVRGTLFAGMTTIENYGEVYPSYAAVSLEAVALTPVDVEAGDRLVVELGGRLSNGTTIGTSVDQLIGESGSDAPILEFSTSLFAGTPKHGWWDGATVQPIAMPA